MQLEVENHVFPKIIVPGVGLIFYETLENYKPASKQLTSSNKQRGVSRDASCVRLSCVGLG